MVPVVALKPVAGDQEYVSAPDAVNEIGAQDPLGVIVSVGNGFTVRVPAADVAEPQVFVTTTLKLFPL